MVGGFHEGTHQMGSRPDVHRRVREWAQDRAWNGFRAGGAQPGTESHGVGAYRHGRLFGVRRGSYP